MASGIEVRCTYPGLSPEFTVHETADDWDIDDNGSLTVLKGNEGVAAYPSGHWTRVQSLDPFDGDSDTATTDTPGTEIDEAMEEYAGLADDAVVGINIASGKILLAGQFRSKIHKCKPPALKETTANFHVCSCGQVYEPRVTLDAERVWVRVDRSITGGDKLNPEWLKSEAREIAATARRYKRERDNLADQIDQLAQFIMNKFPRWVGDGGAVNAAINILSEYTKDKKTNIINNPDRPVRAANPEPVCTNPEHSGMDKHRVGRYIGCYVAPVPESSDPSEGV